MRATLRLQSVVLGLAVAALPLTLRAAGGRIAGAAQASSPRLEPCDTSDFTVTRFFDTLPVDLSTVSGIIPLGNVNGTSHILPISTTYFQTPSTMGGVGGHDVLPDFPNQPIHVPGDVTITALRWEPNSGGVLIAGDDWYVNFRPCKDIRFTFHHLNAITGPPALVARARQIRRGVNAWCTYDSTGAATSCSGLADVSVAAGTIVGTVFRTNQSSFNFTAYDTRSPATTPAPPTGTAIVPSRYELTYDQLIAALTAGGDPVPRALTRELFAELDPSRTHARCPLDYFDSGSRALLDAKLGSFDGSVASLDGCGHVFQDNPDGGLAGGWFPEALTSPFLLGGEDILAGFLYGNVNPFKMYFSIGTSVAPLGEVLSFAYPGFDNGSTHNQSFKGARFHPELSVQPVYCWDGLVRDEMAGGASFVPAPVAGVMLVQFTSATRIGFEYSATGTCAAPPSFTPSYFVR